MEEREMQMAIIEMSAVISVIHGLLIDIKHKPENHLEPIKERFVSKNTVAKLWDCNVDTVDRAISRGLITEYQIVNSIRFKFSEVIGAAKKR